MPSSRSRSRSPKRLDERGGNRQGSRSRSPPPRRRRSPPRHSGFHWKSKPRRDDDDNAAGDSRSLQRGYRPDRNGDRWTPRDRDRNQDRDRNGDRDRDRNKSPRRDRDYGRDRDRDRDRDRNRDRDSRRRREDDHQRRRDDGERKEQKDKEKSAVVAPPPAISASGESMIIVTVNDRLGTKAQIPCLASDPIKLFKAQVAARIGRQPHEIMLKRQGERPFKDQLTLEDYGVSNGVQLDLELDTGD